MNTPLVYNTYKFNRWYVIRTNLREMHTMGERHHIYIYIPPGRGVAAGMGVADSVSQPLVSEVSSKLKRK